MPSTDFCVVIENLCAAGGQLKGSVYIDAPKQISGTQLLVELTGYEKTVVRYEDGDFASRKMVPKRFKETIRGMQSALECLQGDNNNSNWRRSKDASVRILSVQTPVGTQDMIDNRKIEPGQYKMPFTIDLPASLPATTNLSVEDGSCEIYYELKAHLKGSGWFKDYRSTCHVQMQAQPQEDAVIIPYEAPPETKAIRMLYCKPMGNVTFACHLESTQLIAGQPVTVAVACRNCSSLNMNNIQAEIVQCTHWETSGHESDHEKVIASQSFGSWKDLEAGGTEADQGTLYKELQAQEHKLNLVVPIHAAPSYQGQLIGIEHFVRVRFVSEYHFDFVAPCPSVDIPIQILAAAANMTPPIIDLPPWANDVANLLVSTVVGVSLQAMQYQGVVQETTEGDITVSAEPVPVIEGDPSFDKLLQAMKHTSNDLGLVNQKLLDPAWHTVFATLSSHQFSAMLTEVNQEFHKPVVATRVAAVGTHFSCAHVAGAVRISPEWMRPSMAGALLSFAKDVQENKHLVLQELNEWEKLMMEEAIKEQEAENNNRV